MMRSQILPAVLLTLIPLATGSCGDNSDQPPAQAVAHAVGPSAQVAGATGCDALPEAAQLQIDLEWTRESWEEDIHSEGDEPHEFSAPRHERFLVALDGGHVRGWEEEGIAALRVVRDGAGWMKVGAAVVDLTPAEIAAANSEVEDWVTLLGATESWPGLEAAESPALDQGIYLVGGEGKPDRRVMLDATEGVPARIEYLAPGAAPDAASAVGTLIPAEWRAWEAAGGLRFPQSLERSLSVGARNTIERTTIQSLEVLPVDVDAFPQRPVTDGPISLGTPTPRSMKSGAALMVKRDASLTALPGAHLLLRKGIAVSRSSRRSPDLVSFESYPDAAGKASFSVICPVALSRETEAEEVPPGVASGSHRGGQYLVFPYTGAYPHDETLQKRVEAEARERGLEPLGPALFAILGDPVSSAPGALEMEILLPVRHVE